MSNIMKSSGTWRVGYDCKISLLDVPGSPITLPCKMIVSDHARYNQESWIAYVLAEDAIGRGNATLFAKAKVMHAALVQLSTHPDRRIRRICERAIS